VVVVGIVAVQLANLRSVGITFVKPPIHLTLIGCFAVMANQTVDLLIEIGAKQRILLDRRAFADPPGLATSARHLQALQKQSESAVSKTKFSLIRS